MAQPGPGLKVDLVEQRVAQALFGPAQADTPDIGIAAKLPSVDFGRGLDVAEGRSFGKGLHACIGLDAAAFQQGHAQPLANEFARQADAGWAGADDAQVAVLFLRA